MNVVLTGVGLALPTATTPQDLLDAPGSPGSFGEAAVRPVDPAAVVGRKGLRYKDRATQLVYCAADRALRDAGLLTGDGLTVPSEGVGVVASSNLGNADTVVAALQTLTAEGSTATSPMDLPNASSNVVATSTAIRFSLRGPNLMLCNGATSGVDALHWARMLIGSGRARQVLVVGVEPEHAVGARLLGGMAIDGAAAVVLEDADAARDRGARFAVATGRYLRTGDLRRCVETLVGELPGPVTAWCVPEAAAEPQADVLPRTDRWRPDPRWGYAGGALGVIQCAWAAARLGQDAGSVLITAGGDRDDATSGMLLTRVAGG